MWQHYRQMKSRSPVACSLLHVSLTGHHPGCPVSCSNHPPMLAGMKAVVLKHWFFTFPKVKMIWLKSIVYFYELFSSPGIKWSPTSTYQYLASKTESISQNWLNSVFDPTFISSSKTKSSIRKGTIWKQKSTNRIHSISIWDMSLLSCIAQHGDSLSVYILTI